MKKLHKLCIVLGCVALIVCGGSFAYASSTDFPIVYVDGKQLDIRAVVTYNDSTLVPYRAIFEQYGMNVEWNDKTKTVAAMKDDIIIKMSVSSYDAFVNDKKVKLLQVPSIGGDGMLYVNLRFISETIGATVDWKKLSPTKAVIHINFPKA